MAIDYLRLMQDESTDLADFVAGLAPNDWDAATLCEGWRVRDVLAHMASGHTSALLPYLWELAKVAGSTDRVSRLLVRRYTAGHSDAQILAEFRRGTAGKPAGPTALVPVKELFVDHLVHHQDIRRALGRPRRISTTRLTAALAALPALSSRVGSAARMRPIRVVADDVEFSRGDGPLVQGPAEALIMALCGRGQAVADLRGEGVAGLDARLQAEASARTAVAGGAR